MGAKKKYDNYLTVKEAAELMNVSVTTIYRLLKKKDTKFPYLDIAGTIRIPEAKLYAWIKANSNIDG